MSDVPKQLQYTKEHEWIRREDDGTVVVVGDCTLDRTNVDGNVLLEIGGDLLALRARVNGNVQTDGAERVRIRRAEVGGDIQLTGVYGSSRSEVLSTASNRRPRSSCGHVVRCVFFCARS